MQELPKLAVITPCFNEEESARVNLTIISNFIDQLINDRFISQQSFLCVIDDGSTDDSLNQLKIASEDCNVSIQIIELSKNSGHQRALLAGLQWANNKCDCSISIDFDLQDDIRCIPAMIEKFKSGHELVLGIRNNRDTDRRFKRWSASFYYKIAKNLGMSITPQHADFRLVSNRVMNKLNNFNESDIYLRSIIPQLTNKISHVYYRRAQRKAGESKYTLFKMIRLARQSIFAQTNALLLGIGAMIVIYSLLSMIILGWVIINLLAGVAVPGWASILITIFITSTVTLIIQYMMAEYMTLMARDIKKRPQYIIESVISNNPKYRERKHASN